MFFLAANGVSYVYPIADPFFGAELETNFTYRDNNIPVTIYESNSYITTLGCADQFQICNPANFSSDGQPLCTPLGGVNAIPNEALKIGLTTTQYATVETIVISLRASNMFYSVSGRGSSALKAQSTVFTLTQVAQLPINQWQIELDGWFATSLASLQLYLYEKALGPVDVLENGGSISRPSNPYEQALCQRQMIRNVSGYQNFSTLGVAIILILGCFLVVLGWVIDSVVGWMQRRIWKRDFARLSWISDGYFQLQRMAYEGAGYERWLGAGDSIPIAVGAGERMRLGGLDVEDGEHPRLVKGDVEMRRESSLYQFSPVYEGSEMYQGGQTWQGSPHEPMKQGLLAHQARIGHY